MTELTCLIIEDEKPAQEVLKSYIAKVEWLKLAALCDDAVTALDFLRTQSVDLIFLDIQVPGLTGIEFLKVANNGPQVIITTAYSDYAVEAFELDVRDYLKKPFSFERFLKAVNRIGQPPEPSQVHRLEKKGDDPTFAFFNVNKLMVKVRFDQIRYVESMREYVYIHLENEKIVTKMGIGEMEHFLGTPFLRTHRSYIVNLERVTAYNAEEIFVGKVSIPIGTNYKKLIAGRLGTEMPPRQGAT